QAFGEIELRRPSRIVGRKILQFGAEFRIVLGLVPVALQVKDQRHQRFGDETPAEYPEHALLVGSGAEGIRQYRLVHRNPVGWRARVSRAGLCLSSREKQNRFAASSARSIYGCEEGADQPNVLYPR